MNKINRKLKKICLITLVFILISFVSKNFSIADENQEPTVYSQSCILVESKTGQILFEHNGYEKMYPASTTKLMTAILTLENCQLSDTVTVTEKALSGIPPTYTVANLKVGETYTVDQLLHALLIPSANDAANVLACHVAGSISSFSNMMNSKAEELGATNTHFVNPSGVHNEEHYSTAYDMALIGRYASQFEKICEIAKETEYDFPPLADGTERKFKNTNALISETHNSYYEYATRFKNRIY